MAENDFSREDKNVRFDSIFTFPFLPLAVFSLFCRCWQCHEHHQHCWNRDYPSAYDVTTNVGLLYKLDAVHSFPSNVELIFEPILWQPKLTSGLLSKVLSKS